LNEGVVIYPSWAAFCHFFEEFVGAYFINTEATEEMQKFALCDRSIIITINNSQSLAHMGEALRRLLPHFLQHVVKFILDLSN